MAVNEHCIDKDRHWTVKELAKPTGISVSTVLQNYSRTLKCTRFLLSGCHMV